MPESVLPLLPKDFVIYAVHAKGEWVGEREAVEQLESAITTGQDGRSIKQTA